MPLKYARRQMDKKTAIHKSSIYRAPSGGIKIDVRFETVQNRTVNELFQ